MRVLVVGASGATGRLLVEQLLHHHEDVIAIVRSKARFLGAVRNHDRLRVIEASVLNLSDEELSKYVNGCGAIASCLGHNLTFKGILGKPRLLVMDATRRLCNAVKSNQPDKPVRFVLMNTTGNRNRNAKEKISPAHWIVIGLLRLLLPPQRDNERAAEYLRCTIGRRDEAIEWVAVRPDSLTNEKAVTDVEIHPSPIRDPIFNAGTTSRINVAHFMMELVTTDETWNKWKWQMPVVYNKS